MAEIKYCSVCYETDVEDGETLCLDCRMQNEAELQQYYAKFDFDSMEVENG